MKATFVIRLASITVILFTLGLLVGCEPVAYKITPVPVDKSLEEEILIDEGGWSPTKIVLVDVDGLLFNYTKHSLFGEGENPVSLFVEKLDKAAKDHQAQALILRINSPGGSVTASDLMHSEVMHFKQRTGGQRPVVAVLMDVAASGGYYIACSADEIVASPTTVTGSVGVIMQMINFSGTMSRIGITADAIKSGPMKDAGSPLREMKPEEREIFQSLVNQFYDRFVQVVASGRPKLDEKQVREIADGRVWSAPQALELGIIDRVGTLRDALVDVKQKIGAKRVRVVTYKRPLGWKPNIYAQSPTGPTQFNMINLDLRADWLHPEPQFLYLWTPEQ